MSALVGSEKSISPPQGQSSLPGHRTRTGWYFMSRLALVLMRASHRPYVVSAPDHLAAMPPVLPLASPWTILAGGQEGRRAGGQAGRRAGGQEGRRAGGQEGRRAGGQE